MNIGTKSILFGAHCFFIHPWFVALAWWRLYGFPFDARLWVAFFVHDLGYWGKPNMDGPEGEVHPFTGAGIMSWLFDNRDTFGHHIFGRSWFAKIAGPVCDFFWDRCPEGRTWYCFSFYHSRFLCKRYGAPFSRLCVADKLATVLTPAFIYLPMANWTGEVKEYMDVVHAREGGRYANEGRRRAIADGDQRAWLENVKSYMRDWIDEHKDGREDTWTPTT